MSRVLLVSTNVTCDPYPVHPLGMAILAGALAARGHEVAQFDVLAEARPEEAFAARIAAFQPEVLGFSLRNLDSCDSLATTDYPSTARHLVAVARAHTRAPIVLGGPAFSILPAELLAYTGADCGVVGEGEVTGPLVVEALAAGRPVPPIQRGAVPEVLGAPAYDPAIARFYLERSGLLNVQTQRGCDQSCVYCNYADLEGTRIRRREPGAVADDLARARRDLGAEAFFLADALFNGDPGYRELAEEILRRGLDVTWSCYMRPQGLRAEDLRLLKRAGLRAAELGTDAACDATLRGLGKGFTFAEVVEANEAFVEARVPCAHFVMFGGPGETAATVEEGLANLERLRHTVVFAFSGIRILPGTPLLGLAQRQGLATPGAPLLEPLHYFAPGLDRQAMEARIAAVFKGRRDRVFPPSRGRERLEALRALGFKGLLWDTLVRFPVPA